MSADQLDELLAKQCNLMARTRTLLVVGAGNEQVAMQLRVILRLAQDVHDGLGAARSTESGDTLSRPKPATRG